MECFPWKCQKHCVNPFFFKDVNRCSSNWQCEKQGFCTLRMSPRDHVGRFFLFFLFLFPTLERLSENKKRLLAKRRRKAAVCLFSQCDRRRLIECWLYCLMQTGFSIYINEGAAFRQIHIEIGVDNAAPQEGKKAGCVINSADMLKHIFIAVTQAKNACLDHRSRKSFFFLPQ